MHSISKVLQMPRHAQKKSDPKSSSSERHMAVHDLRPCTITCWWARSDRQGGRREPTQHFTHFGGFNTPP
eukprot:208533-Prymnesium_polylepis.3